MTWEMLQNQQNMVARILMNSIKKDRLAHAYLFEGVKGSGKIACAIQLAQTFFCENRHGIEPCHQCVECRRIESGNHPDVIKVVPEGQSIKKQQVADLIKAFTYHGMESSKKFFIIESAEKMTTQAANSLLKFIEEPSQQTIAVLTTENVHHMLDTIISRCQVLSFTRLKPEIVENELIKQGISSSLSRLASKLTQNMDEGVELCHNEWFATARNIMIKLIQSLSQRQEHPFFILYEDYAKAFEDIDQAQMGLDLLLFWYQDLLHMQLGEEEMITYIDQKDLLSQQVLHSSLRQISEGISAIFAAKQRLGAYVPHQSVIEQLVLKLQGGN